MKAAVRAVAAAAFCLLLAVCPDVAAAPKRRAAKKVRAVPSAEIESTAALAAFFGRLGGRETARVLHLGDSHVAADYWTGELRRLLQERYGDAGPGYVMPGKPWRFFRHSLAKSVSSGGWETVGVGSDPGDGLYGLSGAALSPTGEEGAAGAEAVFSGYRVSFLGLSKGACASVSVDGVTQFAGVLDTDEDEEPEACCRLGHRAVGETAFQLVTIENAAPLPLSSHRLEIRDACGGPTRVLGVDLTSGRPGVLVDTLGSNGAEVTALARWQGPLRRLLLREADPALVIVSYGTNDMGRSDFDFAEYRTKVTELLRGLHEDVPEASILVTGPIDRGVRGRRGAAEIRRNGPLVTRALAEAASRTGCAFWDARAAMGGAGSIRRWRASGLAQRDLVHLTGPGYVKLARLLFDRLEAAASYWRGGR